MMRLKNPKKFISFGIFSIYNLSNVCKANEGRFECFTETTRRERKNMTTLEIRRLVVKAKQQEPDAFTILMQHFSKDMYRTAIAILLNDEDAADAIQDTILTCWEKISTLREERFFKTWMTRILINKCYDIRKQRIDKVSIEECEELVAADSEQSYELNEILSQLSERYRLPMMLFYGEGYKIAEIAQLLHIPKSTVQTRLARGREKLATYMKEV